MNIRKIIVIASVFVLSACATARVNVNDSQAVSSAVSVERDDFKKITKYEAPNASTELVGQLFLRSWKVDDVKVAGVTIQEVMHYQIYVMDNYGSKGWRFYDSAYDSNGNKLNTTLIKREVSSCSSSSDRCSYEEHIGLNVTREYLDEYKETGIRFKVSGRGGEEVFFVPAGYIKGFLLAVK